LGFARLNPTYALSIDLKLLSGSAIFSSTECEYFLISLSAKPVLLRYCRCSDPTTHTGVTKMKAFKTLSIAALIAMGLVATPAMAGGNHHHHHHHHHHHKKA